MSTAAPTSGRLRPTRRSGGPGGPGGPRAPRAGRARLPMPRLSLKLIAALMAVVVVLGCMFLWVRQSSLVAIKQVRVAGLSGPGVTKIHQALVNSALTMTTLDVSTANLERAVSGYPEVYSLRVSTHFPHGLVIDVVEHVPVAMVSVGSRAEAVDGDGLLLPSASVASLPSVPLRTPPGGANVTPAGARAALQVLAAAPYQFLPHIQNATSTAAHGVVLQLRDGPQVYFGPASQLADKWKAALGVLAHSGSAGADYIDVSNPTRSAAGA
jgi:cell division protein FtsQ